MSSNSRRPDLFLTTTNNEASDWLKKTSSPGKAVVDTASCAHSIQDIPQSGGELRA